MKELFTDIYNKVLNFFQNTKDEDENTKDTACNRLKLVLMQDRVHMDPFIMQKMREEMISILNKYLEIDNEALDLNLAGEGDSIALMFNIPVIRAKSNEEIEEYEKELKVKLAAEAQAETETSEENEQEDDSETSDEEADVTSEEETEEADESDEKDVEDSEDEQEVQEESAEEVEENAQVPAEETSKKDKKSSKKSEN